MTLSIKVGVRNSMLDAIAVALDAGAGPGKIAIYSGTRPATAEDALSGNTKLVEFVLNDPSCSAAGSGALQLQVSPPVAAAAVASGTATFFRATDSDSAVVLDGSVGTSGADLNVSTTSITSGQTISITSGNLAQLAG